MASATAGSAAAVSQGSPAVYDDVLFSPHMVQRLVLAVCATALAAHGLTAYWDVSYAEQRRRVTPVEQHIHSVF